jgi:hypothetical protein
MLYFYDIRPILSDIPGALSKKSITKPCLGIAVHNEGIICMKWQHKTNQIFCRYIYYIILYMHNIL